MTMNWWVRLSVREKRALLATAMVLLLVVYYLAFWAPLSRDIALQRQAISQLEADYRHMVEAAAAVTRLQRLAAGGTPPGQPGLKVSLLAKVDSSLQRGGLADALQEIRPDGEQVLRVSLRKSPFEKVVLWLDYLRSEGIEVTRASFNADDEPGHVQLTVQLRDRRP
jgi:type II secretory pathway component PulM